MKAYPYVPDERSVRRDLERGPYGVGRVEQTFARGRGQLDTLGIAVDDCWGAAAAAWVLEDPLDVPDLLQRVAVLVRANWQRTPGPIPSWNAVSFAVTLTMAGDRVGVAELADRVLSPDGLQTDAGPAASELAFARLLVALLAGRDAEAAAQPGPPGDGEMENGSFAACRAVLDGDQVGLDEAAAAVSGVRMRLAGRSAQNRRTWIYLLHRAGIGIMLAAQDRGLRPTPGLPDVPVQIIAKRRQGQG